MILINFLLIKKLKFKTHINNMIGSRINDFIHELPEITFKDTKGKDTIWKIFIGVISDKGEEVPIQKVWYSGDIMPSTLYGYYKIKTIVGDVQKITQPTLIKVGKNIGRKNATNAFQQVLAIAQKKHNEKIKKISDLEQKQETDAVEKKETQFLIPFLIIIILILLYYINFTTPINSPQSHLCIAA